jgi:hypothetical protein
MLSSIFVFLSGVWSPFIIFADIIVAVLIIFSNEQEIFCIFAYTFLFMGIKALVIATMVCGFLALIVRYIISVKKHEKKVYVLPLVLTLSFFVVFTLSSIGSGFSYFLAAGMIAMVLSALYVVFACRNEINQLKCSRYMLLGLVVSVVLGLIARAIPNYLIAMSIFDSVGLERFKFFTAHTNHLSVYCLFLIAFAIYNIINKKGTISLNACQIALPLGVGLMTLSKTFIVVCVLFALYVCLDLILKYKLKSLRVIIPIVVVGCVLGLIFRVALVEMLERFFIYGEGNSFMNKITTGRSAIWFSYMELTRSSIKNMLFGTGLFASELIKIGAHNIYLFLLSRVGFVGIIMLGLIIYSYYQASDKNIVLSYKTIFPLATYLLIGIVEQIFSESFWIFLALSIIMLCPPKQSEKRKAEYAKIEKIIGREVAIKHQFSQSKCKNI